MANRRISHQDFLEILSQRSRNILNLSSYVAELKDPQQLLIRPLLGEFISQSMQMEELLDAYGAKNNKKWCRFRMLIATLKLFSNVTYELLHIEHAIPTYRLLPIKRNFENLNQEILSKTAVIMQDACSDLIDQANFLTMPVPHNHSREASYVEQLPKGKLVHDIARHETETVSEIVTLLATAFLNLAAESGIAKPGQITDANTYDRSDISAESLRTLQFRFHNLQSLYDTHVSKTETENLDKDLPILRGHISIVFHLLRIGTQFAHYYERHVKSYSEHATPLLTPLVNEETLLFAIVDYCLLSTIDYIECAKKLCQDMLRKYTETSKVSVCVPRYRGFHVRPSTLVSKLVRHYGSHVTIILEDDIYDASSPLEIFRINEKINAQKRKSLATEIVSQKLVEKFKKDEDIHRVIKSIVLQLAQMGRILIYEQPLELRKNLVNKDSSLLEQVVDEITLLLAIGKIDICTEMQVIFEGDKRVLDDVKLLAENGYGEDNFGNNIPLPDKLTYLRK